MNKALPTNDDGYVTRDILAFNKGRKTYEGPQRRHERGLAYSY